MDALWETNTIAWALILVCLAILPLYYRVKSFKSVKAIVLVLAFGIAVGIKLVCPMPGFGNPFELSIEAADLLLAVLFTLGSWFIILAIGNRSGTNFRGFGYFVKAVGLYLLFAGVEQLLFNFVFTQTVYSLTKGNPYSIWVAAVFFSLFHIQMKKRGRGLFFLGSLAMGAFYAWLYLETRSIVPATVSMALIASVYYTWLCESDVLKFRLS